MKAILLQTATADNGGERRDAGEQLTIGKQAREISSARAEALISALSAVDVSPAEESAKKGN